MTEQVGFKLVPIVNTPALGDILSLEDEYQTVTIIEGTGVTRERVAEHEPMLYLGRRFGGPSDHVLMLSDGRCSLWSDTNFLSCIRRVELG